MRKLAARQNTEPQRILIVRRSSMGDIVHTMPLLVALRRRFPKAYIAWLVDYRFAEVLEGHKCLDEVITIRRYSGRQPLAVAQEICRVRTQLQQHTFDWTLDPQGLLKSGLMCYLSGAPRRIGFTDDHEASRLFVNERIPTSGDTHAVLRALLMAQYLGCPVEPIEYQFPIGEEAERWVGEFFVENRLTVGGAGGHQNRPVIGLNIGARAIHRLWPAEHFARVGEILQTDLGMQTVLIGSPSEVDMAKKIEQLARVDITSAVGQTTMKKLASVLRRCTVVISSDTGPLHMAVAVGTAVVGLYGAADPNKTGPFGDKHIVLTSSLPCSPCVNKPTCADYPCMRQIKPEAVAEAVANLLQRPASAPSPRSPLPAGEGPGVRS